MMPRRPWDQDGRQHVPLRTKDDKVHQPHHRTTSRHADVHTSLHATQTHSSKTRADEVRRSRSSSTARRYQPSRRQPPDNSETSIVARSDSVNTSRSTTPAGAHHHHQNAPLHAYLQRGEVHVGFRVINDDTQYHHSEVERCLVHEAHHRGNTIVTQYPSDFVFGAQSTNESIGNMLIPPILVDAMKGLPTTLVAVGAPHSGKSTTLFSSNGLLRSYVTQLLVELDRHRMVQLWSIRCSVIEAIGDDLVDVLAPSEDTVGSVRDSFESTLKPQEAATHQNPLLRHSHLIETQEDLDDICKRLTRQSKVAKHEVVSVLVVPSQDTNGMEELIRPFGTVSFVELCADMQSISNNSRAQAIVRHGSTSMINVLAALCKRERMNAGRAGMAPPAKGTYVPFSDDMLTDLLHYELDAGSVHLLAHIDGNANTTATQTTLETADRLLSEKFPDGPPQPDFRAIAYELQDQVRSLRKALNMERAEREDEQLAMSSERQLMKKAYDSAATRSESLSHSRPASTVQPVMSAQEAEQLREELKAAKQMLTASQVECSEMREDLAKVMGESHQLRIQVAELEASALQQTTPSRERRRGPLVSPDRALQEEDGKKLLDDEDDRHAAPSTPKPATRVSNGASADVEAAACVLQDLLKSLRQVLNLPFTDSSGGALEPTLWNGTAAVVQLAHQVCERERAYESATRRSMMFQQMDADAMEAESHHGSTSLLQHRELQRRDRFMQLKEELKGAPILGWQKWRRLLSNSSNMVSTAATPQARGFFTNTIVGAAYKPTSRTRAPSNLFLLAEDAAAFNKYWSHQTPFEEGERPPNKSADDTADQSTAIGGATASTLEGSSSLRGSAFLGSDNNDVVASLPPSVTTPNPLGAPPSPLGPPPMFPPARQRSNSPPSKLESLLHQQY